MNVNRKFFWEKSDSNGTFKPFKYCYGVFHRIFLYVHDDLSISHKKITITGNCKRAHITVTFSPRVQLACTAATHTYAHTHTHALIHRHIFISFSSTHHVHKRSKCVFLFCSFLSLSVYAGSLREHNYQHRTITPFPVRMRQFPA